MIVVHIRRLTSLILASALLAGCNFTDHEPGVQRWSGLVGDLRFQWTAEPGIDTSTGPLVPIRAFIESMLLAQYMGDLNYAYPGFAGAVPDDDPKGSVWSRRPSLDGKLTAALVGNNQYHVLSLNRSGGSFVATLCNYMYSTAVQQDNGSFKSAQTGVGDSRGIYAERVAVVTPSDGSTESLPPQEGPQPAPSDDVFGQWKIKGLLNFFSAQRPAFKSEWPTYEADVANCVEKAPDPADRRAFLVNGEHPRSDFPTSPPSPGWPDKH